MGTDPEHQQPGDSPKHFPVKVDQRIHDNYVLLLQSYIEPLQCHYGDYLNGVSDYFGIINQLLQSGIDDCRIYEAAAIANQFLIFQQRFNLNQTRYFESTNH